VNDEAAERYARLKRLGEALQAVVSSAPALTSPGAPVEPPRRALVKPNAPSPLIRSKDARIMIGGRGLLDRCEKAGWLKPVQRGKRMTLYRRKDILAALQRIEWGELG
jgi:hypothetical protein